MNIFSEKTEKYLVFLIFFLFPLADVRVLLFGIPLYVPEILVMMAILTRILRSPSNRLSDGFSWRSGFVAILSIGLMLAGMISSSIWNGIDRDALGAIKSWFLFPILFFWLILTLGFSRGDVWKAVSLWFFGTALTAFAGVFLPDYSIRTYDGRLQIASLSPNHFGFLLEYGGVIGLALLVFLRERHWVFLAFLAIAESVVVAALLLTQSDAALISFCIASLTLVISSIFSLKFSKKLLAAAFIVVASVTLAFFQTIDRHELGSGTVRSSLASRVMIWNAASMMISEHPILGIGPRNFQERYLALQPQFPPYLEWAVPHPHNIFLAFWLFSGISGLLGFVVLLSVLFFNVVRVIFSTPEEKLRVLPSLFLALLSGFLVHGFVDTPYFKNNLAYIFWAMAACIFLLGKEKRRRSAEDAGLNR